MQNPVAPNLSYDSPEQGNRSVINNQYCGASTRHCLMVGCVPRLKPGVKHG